MSKINTLLSQRFKSQTDKPSKMANLAEMSSSGHLSSFSGVFKVSVLNEKESSLLRGLLQEYGQEGRDVQQDFLALSTITSEVKAISNQAVLLHGERIKKAQEVLKEYKEGAFTAWLIQTYGNRQTPYNFLQYYELTCALPVDLLPKLDELPRQAAYTLASREGLLEDKEEMIRGYQGETKDLFLEKIRRAFPLSHRDRRAQNPAFTLIKSLQRIVEFLDRNALDLSPSQVKEALCLLSCLQNHITKKGPHV